MKRNIRPVALCVLLVFGTVPAVPLACEWLCVIQRVQSQTHHSTAGSDSAGNASGGPTLAATSNLCGHLPSSDVAVSATASEAKVLVPVAILTRVSSNTTAYLSDAASSSTSASPPVVQRPLSALRI